MVNSPHSICHKNSQPRKRCSILRIRLTQPSKHYHPWCEANLLANKRKPCGKKGHLSSPCSIVVLRRTHFMPHLFSLDPNTCTFLIYTSCEHIRRTHQQSSEYMVAIGVGYRQASMMTRMELSVHVQMIPGLLSGSNAVGISDLLSSSPKGRSRLCRIRQP